jgi:hypothetical protein
MLIAVDGARAVRPRHTVALTLFTHGVSRIWTYVHAYFGLDVNPERMIIIYSDLTVAIFGKERTAEQRAEIFVAHRFSPLVPPPS